MRFGGIDYDNDPDAIAKLDEFIRHAQRILTSYGGNLLHLTLGDKGAYLYTVFGSPVAHEDDAARAAAAALELRDLASVTAATDIQIGIAHGRLRSGTYGHALRQAFTCLGDAGNLSARLMGKAPPGEIFVPETVRHAAGDVFHLGEARADHRQGQGRADTGVRAEGLEAARVAPAGRERSGRSSAAGGSWNGSAPISTRCSPGMGASSASRRRPASASRGWWRNSRASRASAAS